VQDANKNEGFKTFADSVEVIGKLGQQLAALQADVAAIEKLRVDENGDAEAVVKVDVPGASQIDLRLTPSTMLSVKREEIVRATNALKAACAEILDRAQSLCERCRSVPARHAAPPMADNSDAAEDTTRDVEQAASAAQRSSETTDQDAELPERAPRVEPPRFRDMLLNRHLVKDAAE
jgi:hypothetical protein